MGGAIQLDAIVPVGIALVQAEPAFRQHPGQRVGFQAEPLRLRAGACSRRSHGDPAHARDAGTVAVKAKLVEKEMEQRLVCAADHRCHAGVGQAQRGSAARVGILEHPCFHARARHGSQAFSQGIEGARNAGIEQDRHGKPWRRMRRAGGGIRHYRQARGPACIPCEGA